MGCPRGKRFLDGRLIRLYNKSKNIDVAGNVRFMRLRAAGPAQERVEYGNPV